VNLLRRHPIAIGLLALLLVTAFHPLPPLVDAVTDSPPGDVELVLPTSYVVLAPLSDTLDALTFLSMGRAYWVLVVWAVALAAWGATRSGSVLRRISLALAGPTVIVLLCGAAVLLPRPVPRLVAADSVGTVIDYHAHSEASHDGRRGWTFARLAAWHARQGFQASYVTDHNVIFNLSITDPIRLLPGVEWSVYRQHVVALGPVQPIVRDSFGSTTPRCCGCSASSSARAPWGSRRFRSTGAITPTTWTPSWRPGLTGSRS